RCRDHLVDLIGSELPGAHLVAPEGTYLAWIDLSAFGVDDPADRLLEEARVAVAAGGPFGSGCDRFIRFNFATTTAWLEESVMRIADVLVSR
ncbi:MAG: aminotransferase class I/II-fold pyridoxal phosphate-dependent enzyme, partial [Acidimicrobiia bacterium]|nr:aminotransferase class I/II-fold pyridoxal phosphate-dependent enzyme [Acidimicrobiia bacterium]